MPLKEGARYYGLQLQNIVHHLRKGAWWQACDVAGHNRKLREVSAALRVIFPFHSGCAPTCGVVVLTSEVNLSIWNPPNIRL